ncbi:urea ABC transporter ATP-binding protein UrtD [Bacillus spizizenii ATCC 6633 = JCM 2499]|uniref:Urea ABC transporter, ATP-binding protein UrtD n=1 Tax=Bacillus spizizenii (strain ATCC 23059 / NRRL B-14472 / W23) TaxID=655816 RepID=E0TUM9_BACSH|nr:urea ABC transporter ATP-binding protein UrtD [Bacillus spizizenii]QCJ18711.1 urea ABC transporter ATP-binding protein UrtD [Bacillus subtilis]ADM39649.1 urea ABC transporter, ATP-binding protein UrtD [Bacillus spizizenii str. W23]AJW85112.1 urea ABC transporter ATP-binding protein [Bacillus spizizenii]EFG92292.1 urea ABC transporter, ATP-binding protein UrtD [Bacillus spizizenii ATCC 6633 = JCM 2499]KFK78053.1 urea ABC transporter, ATP-binding protein UrtD [Bacillus spizizenii]
MKPILTCRDVKVEFDGFWALQGADISVQERDIHFLIGPNGAGKTTLLDIICGKTKPHSGEVLFQETNELTKAREYQIAKLGVARKFQAPSVFTQLTVFENLELAMKQKKTILSLLTARMTKEQSDRIIDILRLIGLDEKRDLTAGSLSHGQKQWLEIGMQLAMEPKLLLLDEPIAGMTGKEREKTGALLEEISKTCSVLIVEHDMDFVRSFSRKVTVMHEGKVLCEGSMDDITSNEEVAAVYLGRGGVS